MRQLHDTEPIYRRSREGKMVMIYLQIDDVSEHISKKTGYTAQQVKNFIKRTSRSNVYNYLGRSELSYIADTSARIACGEFERRCRKKGKTVKLTELRELCRQIDMGAPDIVEQISNFKE